MAQAMRLDFPIPAGPPTQREPLSIALRASRRISSLFENSRKAKDSPWAMRPGAMDSVNMSSPPEAISMEAD